MNADIEVLEEKVRISIDTTKEELEKTVKSLEAAIYQMPVNNYDHVINISVLLNALKNK